MSEPAIKRLVASVVRSVNAFWNDTSGLMLPYVTLMLTVLVGFGLLALDGARFMSLQTQMQAAADALALAGARELDTHSGAQARAISAMANAYGSATVPNTLSGMGTAPTLTYTYTFYKSLPAASAGMTGTAATGDTDSKYVQVTVDTVSVPTIFPVSFVKAGASNNFAAGASAIAGFTGILVCGVTPIFICNPYETAGMTDTQATQALDNAYKDTATLRQMFRMDRLSSISPGHFGWVQTADGCNTTNCMRDNIAQVAGACYHSYNVQLATGNMNSVEQYFNTRFDIYAKPLPTGGISSTNAPAINVRKGYLPVVSGISSDWCSALPGNQTVNPHTSQTATTYYTTPILTTTGTTTTNKMITGVPSADMANVGKGQTILGSTIKADSWVTDFNNPLANTITMNNNASSSGSATLTLKWPTSGLPQDTWSNLGGVEGNGQWDCKDYWIINHPNVAVSAMIPNPPGETVGGGACGDPTTTGATRYAVYRYEINNNLINDWSGNGSADNTVGPPGNGESGAPFCAANNGVAGVDKISQRTGFSTCRAGRRPRRRRLPRAASRRSQRFRRIFRLPHGRPSSATQLQRDSPSWRLILPTGCAATDRRPATLTSRR
jgi:hypothetical protein